MSFKLDKFLLLILFLVTPYTFYKFYNENKTNSFYSLKTKEINKFDNKKYTVLFICSFGQNYSVNNLNVLKEVDEMFVNLNDQINFYYVFSLNDLGIQNFALINSIIFKNNISIEKCLYINLRSNNNFVKKNNLKKFPVLIVLDKNEKIIYKKVGYIKDENCINEILQIINKN